MLNKIYTFLGRVESETFKKLRSGKKISLSNYSILLIKGFFSLIESIIRNISGPFGYIIRRYYYKMVFNKMGEDVLIDVGVVFNGAQNITCGSKVWIDSYSLFSFQIGKLEIGNYVHIHSHTFLGGRDKITIEDEAGISSGSKLFTGGISITPKDKKLLNPMMNEYSVSAVNTGPIKIKKNAMILSNCVLSPNIVVGEGSILLSCSFLTKSTPDYSIFVGSPASQIGERPNNIDNF